VARINGWWAVRFGLGPARIKRPVPSIAERKVVAAGLPASPGAEDAATVNEDERIARIHQIIHVLIYSILMISNMLSWTYVPT
jgi:hypothetical protein